MLKRFWTSSMALAAAFLFATSSSALERKAVPAPDRADEWNAGTSCIVNYYNVCTGWAWAWSGFGDGAKIGTVFDSCANPLGATLMQTSIFVVSGAPSGYGFTGTIAVHNVDANDCPIGAPIASQSFLPTLFSQFQLTPWNSVVVPARFAVVVTLEANDGLPNPSSFGTDRPAEGPTGPQACGLCYPANRVNHSFQYGTAAAPICPGSPFNDGVCDAQLFWDAWMIPPGVGVEPASWGSIKSLYR